MTVITKEAVDTENQVTTTQWSEIVSKTFTINSLADYIVWISLELTNAATNRVASARILVDNVEESITSQFPAVANEFVTYSPIILLHLTPGEHTISIQARTSNASYATTIRRKRLVVMKH